MSDAWDWFCLVFWPRVRRGWRRRLLGMELRLCNLERCLPAGLSRVHPHAIGRLGERLAALHLRRAGGRLLWRNYRCPDGGEIDLGFGEGRGLGFVEVKTRARSGAIRPALAVNRDKRRLVRKAAWHWHRRIGNPRIPLRFDIVELVLQEGSPPRVQRLRDAFGWNEAQ